MQGWAYTEVMVVFKVSFSWSLRLPVPSPIEVEANTFLEALQKAMLLPALARGIEVDFVITEVWARRAKNYRRFVPAPDVCPEKGVHSYSVRHQGVESLTRALGNPWRKAVVSRCSCCRRLKVERYNRDGLLMQVFFLNPSQSDAKAAKEWIGYVPAS